MLKKPKSILIIILFTVLFLSPQVFADGKKIDLSSYKGKVVVIDFWASWCVPCRKSFPWLNKMQNNLKTKGLVILGVNVDENNKDAKNFLDKYPANFSIIFDPQGKHAEYYKIIGMPSSLVFDRQGNLVEQHVGFKEKYIEEYENTINKILAK